MIHAFVDNPIGRNVVGYECGTRADFDFRHGNDPHWIFVDNDTARYQINLPTFLMTPSLFYFDESGNLLKGTQKTPPILNKAVYIVDPDGAYITDDATGDLLTEATD